MQPSGKREVFFEVNGIPRVVEVVDRRSAEAVGKKEVRERCDTSVMGSVGAPMAGSVIDVTVKPGSKVHVGQQLVVLSAMKMETTVNAPVPGLVTQVPQRCCFDIYHAHLQPSLKGTLSITWFFSDPQIVLPCLQFYCHSRSIGVG